MEPVCGTLGNLSAPNNPEAFLEEPQAFQAVGENTVIKQPIMNHGGSPRAAYSLWFPKCLYSYFLRVCAYSVSLCMGCITVRGCAGVHA